MSEKPPEWAADLLAAQSANQSANQETLRGFGEQLKHSSETLNGFAVAQGKVETRIEGLEKQSDLARAEDRADRNEGVAAVTKAHDRINELDKVAGQFKNHVEDDHATKAAETAKALDEHTKDGHAKSTAETATALEEHSKDLHAQVAHDARSDLNEHMINNDRHTGEAPGPGRSVAKTAGLAAGGVTGTGVILFLLNALKDYLSS